MVVSEVDAAPSMFPALAWIVTVCVVLLPRLTVTILPTIFETAGSVTAIAPVGLTTIT